MIQRIQTIYMLAVMLIATLSLFLGLDFFRGILFALSAIVAVYAILKYKKRIVQQRLNWLNILINLTLLGIFAYRMLSASGESFISEKGVGLFVPALSIVFLFLANKAIGRDEKLVKSADRLR